VSPAGQNLIFITFRLNAHCSPLTLPDSHLNSPAFAVARLDESIDIGNVCDFHVLPVKIQFLASARCHPKDTHSLDSQRSSERKPIPKQSFQFLDGLHVPLIRTKPDQRARNAPCHYFPSLAFISSYLPASTSFLKRGWSRKGSQAGSSPSRAIDISPGLDSRNLSWSMAASNSPTIT
jgi:hypothetical protein